MIQDYGPVVKIFLAHRPYVVLSRPAGFEAILSSNKHITKGPDYRFLWPWLNQGLLTAAGKKWHGRRKMLTPAFHFRILEDFQLIMNDNADLLVKKMRKLADGKPFNIFPHITYAALDIITQAAMGKDIGAQREAENAYVKAVFSASDVTFHRVLSPWIWSWLAFKLSWYKRHGHKQILMIAFS